MCPALLTGTFGCGMPYGGRQDARLEPKYKPVQAPVSDDVQPGNLCELSSAPKVSHNLTESVAGSDSAFCFRSRPTTPVTTSDELGVVVYGGLWPFRMVLHC
jgi:hypothetical protein